jgi:SAM-dependent methyltransferase
MSNSPEDTSLLIRRSYDEIADEYERRISGELEGKPFDRDVLKRFAQQVQGKVCDLGCGPGHVTAFLRGQGADVFGIDLSPVMVEIARRRQPDLVFEVGDMLALNLPVKHVTGIVTFYSIVNLPERMLPVVFREMLRVLQPGGLLLLAFHIGDQFAHYEELWGRPICLDFYYFEPVRIRRMLESAGFAIEDAVERDPYPPEVEHQSRRAYVWARKPQ